jgi:hypothetical protein
MYEKKKQLFFFFPFGFFPLFFFPYFRESGRTGIGPSLWSAETRRATAANQRAHRRRAWWPEKKKKKKKVKKNHDEQNIFRFLALLVVGRGMAHLEHDARIHAAVRGRREGGATQHKARHSKHACCGARWRVSWGKVRRGFF